MSWMAPTHTGEGQLTFQLLISLGNALTDAPRNNLGIPGSSHVDIQNSPWQWSWEATLKIRKFFTSQMKQRPQNLQEWTQLLNSLSHLGPREFLACKFTFMGLPRCLKWWRICLPTQEPQIQTLGPEVPLKKEMATHSIIFATCRQWVHIPSNIRNSAKNQGTYWVGQKS